VVPGGERRLVRRLGELAAPTLFERAAFVPPGYSSLLYAHLYEAASCARPTPLFAGFRDFLLRQLRLHNIRKPPDAPVKVPHLGTQRCMHGHCGLSIGL